MNEVEAYIEGDEDYYPDNPIWTTGDGTDIPVQELEDKHLLNIDKFIERKLVQMEDTACMIDPDKAGIDGEISNAEWWQCIIVQEIKRRGLKEGV